MTKIIMVPFGGVSTEHLVSCRSAYNIISGLTEAGYKVIPVGIEPTGNWGRFNGSLEDIRDMKWHGQLVSLPLASSQGLSVKQFLQAACDGELPDVVFPAVHGINCEDGSLQGLLELSGIPYVGSGVLASAILMDKLYAKNLFAAAGLPQCRFMTFNRDEIRLNTAAISAQIIAEIGLPCFLKPANGGSSVGTMRADDLATLKTALVQVSAYDYQVIIEEYIDAREIEVAVLGNESPRASLAGEISTNSSVPFYDYQTKYFSDEGANIFLPAQISESLMAEVRALAIKAYLLSNAKGLSRVDFFLDRKNGQLYLNEINTLPGFTPISLYPKAWEVSGLTLSELVSQLVELAFLEAERKKRLEIV